MNVEVGPVGPVVNVRPTAPTLADLARRLHAVDDLWHIADSLHRATLAYLSSKDDARREFESGVMIERWIAGR